MPLINEMITPFASGIRDKINLVRDWVSTHPTPSRQSRRSTLREAARTVRCTPTGYDVCTERSSLQSYEWAPSDHNACTAMFSRFLGTNTQPEPRAVAAFSHFCEEFFNHRARLLPAAMGKYHFTSPSQYYSNRPWTPAKKREYK